MGLLGTLSPLAPLSRSGTLPVVTHTHPSPSGLEVPWLVPILQREPLGGPALTSALLGDAIVRATVATNIIDKSFIT
jgi:hypothetical protein